VRRRNPRTNFEKKRFKNEKSKIKKRVLPDQRHRKTDEEGGMM